MKKKKLTKSARKQLEDMKAFFTGSKKEKVSNKYGVGTYGK